MFNSTIKMEVVEGPLIISIRISAKTNLPHSKIKRNIIPKILSYYSFACVFAMVRRKEKRENTFNYSNSVVLFNQSIDIRNQI